MHDGSDAAQSDVAGVCGCVLLFAAGVCGADVCVCVLVFAGVYVVCVCVLVFVGVCVIINVIM